MSKFMLYLSWIGQFLGIFIFGSCIAFIYHLGWQPEFILSAIIALIAFVIAHAFEKYLKNKEAEAFLYNEE